MTTKDDTVRQLLGTCGGAAKLAASMQDSLALRVDFPSMLSKMFVLGGMSSDGPVSLLLSGIYRHRFSWVEMGLHSRVSLVEQVMDLARSKMTLGLDAHLFKHLQKFAGDAQQRSTESLCEAVKKLSWEDPAENSLRKVHFPSLLMNARTYADYRRAGMMRDTEARLTLFSGPLPKFEGCDVLVSRQVVSDHTLVVSRRPTQVRGPVSVRVEITQYVREPDDKGFVEFEFEATMPVAGDWPEAIWLH